MEFYLFLSSSDGKNMHPNNSYHDFTITLPKMVHLPNMDKHGVEIKWSMALCEIYLQLRDAMDKSYNIAVMCDLVEQSYLNSSYAPVIRIFPGETIETASLFSTYNIQLSTNSFSSVRIYLQDLSGLTLPNQFGSTVLSCVLHFQLMLL